MKFWQKFIIIYITIASLSFGQEAGSVNDFLLGLAKEGLPEEGLPKQNVPEKNVPKQNVSEKNVPKQNLPEENLARQERIESLPKEEIDEIIIEEIVIEKIDSEENKKLAEEEIIIEEISAEEIKSKNLQIQEYKESDEDVLNLAKRETPNEVLKQAPEDIALTRASTNSFLLMGKNAFGFSQIKEVISTAEDILLEYLGLNIDSRNKINLQIISSDDTEYKEQFYINSYADASMYLSLRWDENLEYEAFCKFIMGAMLRKVVLEKRLAEENYKISYFLELGLSTLLSERSNKGLSIDAARKAKKLKLLTLKDCLSINRSNSQIDKLSAYWNILALRRFYTNKSDLHSICAKLLSGESPEKTYEQIAAFYPKGNLESYFKCIVEYELSLRMGGVFSMEDSAEELLRLSFIRKDSQNLAFGDKDIFKNNKDKELRASIERRIIEIKLFLGRINPAYFNALVSLGEMLESALADNEDNFESARLSFISFFREGKYLESKAKMLIERF